MKELMALLNVSGAARPSLEEVAATGARRAQIEAKIRTMSVPDSPSEARLLVGAFMDFLRNFPALIEWGGGKLIALFDKTSDKAPLVMGLTPSQCLVLATLLKRLGVEEARGGDILLLNNVLCPSVLMILEIAPSSESTLAALCLSEIVAALPQSRLVITGCALAMALWESRARPAGKAMSFTKWLIKEKIFPRIGSQSPEAMGLLFDYLAATGDIGKTCQGLKAMVESSTPKGLNTLLDTGLERLGDGFLDLLTRVSFSQTAGRAVFSYLQATPGGISAKAARERLAETIWDACT